MKFKTTVEHLAFWLSKAGTVLAMSHATISVDGYLFRVVDGNVQIACTDKHDFCYVLTSIPADGEGEFAVRASVLNTIISNSKESAEIVIEQLEDVIVEIRCGEYTGEKIVCLPLSNFPDFAPVAEKREVLPLSITKFCGSVQRVKYILEDITSPERSRVVFRHGKCWVGSILRFQAVDSGFDENIDIAIPSRALKVVKFLDLSKSNGDEFELVETAEHLFFFSGEDVFIAEKSKTNVSDEEERFDKELEDKKVIAFEIMASALYRAVVLASATCEESSAETVFEFEKNRVFVIGRDKFNNFGYSVLDVDVKLASTTALKQVKSVGWEWVRDAIQATSLKSVKVGFDKKFMTIESDNARAILPFESVHNVGRVKAGKESDTED